jgi:hypothetical protein
VYAPPQPLVTSHKPHARQLTWCALCEVIWRWELQRARTLLQQGVSQTPSLLVSFLSSRVPLPLIPRWRSPLLAWPCRRSCWLAQSRLRSSCSPGLVGARSCWYIVTRSRSCSPDLVGVRACWPRARLCACMSVSVPVGVRASCPACARLASLASLALVLAGYPHPLLFLLPRPCWRSPAPLAFVLAGPVPPVPVLLPWPRWRSFLLVYPHPPSFLLFWPCWRSCLLVPCSSLCVHVCIRRRCPVYLCSLLTS